jgi:DHA1 family bicyclomycin/chloramphenicol resistance-like MFS transporter
MARVVTVSVSLYALFALVLLAVTAAGVDNLAVLIGLLFIAFAWLGLVIPSTMVLALEDHGPIAGMASALGGTLQMLAGGTTIVIVSLCFNGTALPMVAVIALCAAGALILSLAALGRGRLAPQPAE